MSPLKVPQEYSEFADEYREWQQARRNLSAILDRSSSRRVRYRGRVLDRISIGQVVQVRSAAIAFANAFQRQLLLLRHPILLSGSVILLLAIGLATFQFWPSNSYGITIKKIDAFYYSTDRANLKILAQALYPTNKPSDENISKLLSNLLDDSYELQYFIDEGTSLPETTPEMRVAKAKALIIRARMEDARGGSSEVDNALHDIHEAERIYNTLHADPNRTVYLVEALSFRSLILGKQGNIDIALRLNEQGVAQLSGLDKPRFDESDTQFLLARMLANRGIYKAYNAYSLSTELDTELGKKSDSQIEIIKTKIHQLQNDAVADTQNAIGIIRMLTDRNANDESYEEKASRFNINLGKVLPASAISQAISSLKMAVDSSQALFSKYPNSVSAKETVALAMMNYGDTLSSSGQTDQSLYFLNKSKAYYDQLANDYPNIKEFVWTKAFVRNFILSVYLTQFQQLINTGNVLEAHNKKQEALYLIRENDISYKFLDTVYANDKQIKDNMMFYLNLKAKVEGL